MPSGMGGVALCSPGTTNPGAHTVIDVQRHAGGLPYGSFSGPYNIVEGDVGAYNTICVRVAAKYCSVQGRSLVQWF